MKFIAFLLFKLIYLSSNKYSVNQLRTVSKDDDVIKNILLRKQNEIEVNLGLKTYEIIKLFDNFIEHEKNILKKLSTSLDKNLSLKTMRPVRPLIYQKIIIKVDNPVIQNTAVIKIKNNLADLFVCFRKAIDQNKYSSHFSNEFNKNIYESANKEIVMLFQKIVFEIIDFKTSKIYKDEFLDEIHKVYTVILSIKNQFHKLTNENKGYLLCYLQQFYRERYNNYLEVN